MTEYIVRNGQRIAVTTHELPHLSRRRQQRTSETFAKVPLAWAAKAAKATNTRKALVWIKLIYTTWRAKGEPVALSVGRVGSISRQTKCRALRELEAAGLVTVVWRGRKTPLVSVKLRPDA